MIELIINGQIYQINHSQAIGYNEIVRKAGFIGNPIVYIKRVVNFGFYLQPDQAIFAQNGMEITVSETKETIQQNYQFSLPFNQYHAGNLLCLLQFAIHQHLNINNLNTGDWNHEIPYNILVAAFENGHKILQCNHGHKFNVQKLLDGKRFTDDWCEHD